MREQWKFQYYVSDVAKAAEEKCSHHKERLSWWKQQQEIVLQEVRSKGLEIEEPLAMQYAVTAAVRGAQIVVKDEYQQRLNECHSKISFHSDKEREYDGWVQFLSERNGSIELDSKDYLFFFGITSINRK